MNKQLLKIRLHLFALFAILVSYGQSATAQEKTGGTEIVLIDSELQDLSVLTGALKPGVKVAYFDKFTSLETSVENALKENAPVKTLHIVTHGAPGTLYASYMCLNEKILLEQRTEIEKWKENFTSDGSILLYGCNVGKGEEGVKFCRSLSEISGVPVSASNNPTGKSSIGGDWNLEFTTGGSNTPICFSSAIQSYDFLLYKTLVWAGSQYYSLVNPVTNYYNSLSGQSAVQMNDATSTIPDLSDYDMVFVFLPNRTINTTEISNLKALLNKGGRIVWVGEFDAFKANNDIITAAVAALGGHLSIQSILTDRGVSYLPNTHINMSSDIMEGVTQLWGNCVSAINIGGDATVLVNLHDQPTKIMMAQEKIGSGDIVAWADLNLWNAIEDPAYGIKTFLKNLLTKAGARKESMLVASLSTTEAYSVSNNSAISGGNITSDNGSAITERGVCWSTSSVSPTTSNSKIAATTAGTGSFTCKITGLSLGTKYYARAYAISSKGTAYGNTISFTTPSVVNTAPTAVADNFSCKKGGSITGNVMSNDFDDDGNTMTAKIVTAPSYNSGAFTLNADGSFTYTSNGTTAPSDFFSYYLTDGISNSATVGVSIALYTASNAPVGANGSITVNSNENFSFSTSNFTFSDADAGHTFNGINIVTLPLKGILKYNGLPVSAGSICNDVSKLTFNTNGSSGNTSFTFKTVASSAEESATAYTMAINVAGKTAATVTLSGLSQTYTGLPISVTTTTSPSGLPVTVTYNGSATIPTNAGTYAVVATINDGSYEGSATGNLVIGKASLTATATAQTKTYGAANPTLIFSYSGWKNNESESVLDTKPTATTTISATTPVGLQTGAISVAGGVDNNYDFTYVPANFTITKAMLTATATAQTKVYGAANPTLTFSYSGWKNNESESVLDTKPAVATNVCATTPAGIQTGAITVSGGADNNYDFTYVPANFTITKAMLTATAAAQTKVYGATNPTLTFTYSGWLNGESESVLDTKPTATTTVNATTSVGVQAGAISVTGGVDNNYNFTYVPADFTITKAMLTATAAAQTKVYGAANPTLTFSYSGWLNGESESVLDTKPTATTTVNATTSVGVQAGAISVTGGVDNNYNFTYVPADFTITKAMLTATAAAQTKVYGAANPTLTFSYSGWKNNESESVLDTKPAVATNVSATTPAGIQTGAITVSGGADNNYDFTYVPANFTITKAMLTANAAAQTKVYGAANPTLAFTYSGWKNNESESVLDTKPTVATNVSATTPSGILTAAIIVSGGADNNYDFTYVPANFTITKAMLTATATAQTKIYGAANPTLTFSYSGWLNGESESVLDTKPTATTTVSATTPVGLQTGAISVAGGVDNNYNFTYVPADFTITKAMLTATAAAQTKVYGAANPTLTFSYSGWKNNESESVLDTKPAVATNVSATTPAGIQTGAITVSGGVDNNYDFTYVPANFTITKAMLTATAAAQTKVYGAVNPALTFTYAGWKNGESETVLDTKPTIATAVNASTGAGVHTNAVTISGGADNNYDFTYVPASFTITKAMLTATATAQSKIYGTANPVLTYTYSGWQNSDNETVLDTKPTAATSVNATTAVGVQSGAIALSGGADNNYDFTYIPADFTVTKAMLTAIAIGQTKVYGTENPALTFIYSGWKNGENETVLDTKPNVSTTVTATTPVGVHTAAINVSGGSDNNYDFTYVPADFTITKAMLVVSGVKVLDKVYDGNTNATITYTVLSGVVGSDDVAVDKSISGTFAHAGVGTNIDVTPSVNIVGSAITNYSLLKLEGLKANITPKELTVNAAVAKNKIYDGTNVAIIENASLGGVVGTEDVVLSNATKGTFAQSGIGNDIVVNPAMTITGTGIANYILTQPVGLKANITPKELTVSGAIAKNKVYDGTNFATIEKAQLDGVVGTEDVTLSNAATGTFVRSSVGTGIAVTPAMTITGTGIANYTLTQPSGLKADITAAPLAVTDPTIVVDKVYDGSNTADVIAGFLSNLAPEDVGKVFITATATYSNPTVGTDRTITVTYTITGPAAGNYTAPANYTYAYQVAKIVAKQLTITDPTVVINKMVDGNTVAAIKALGSLQGVETVDANNVSITATANYNNATIGTNKTITIVYTISGSASANYIAPVNKVITGAKISDYVTLSPLTTPTPGCEESDLDLAYSILTGTPTQYRITFNDAAHAAGIQDIDYTNLPTTDASGFLPIFVPKGAPDGDYQGTLQFRNELESTSPAYPFQFTINLSTDYIVAKFDDVVLCDNSKERFTSYQWYKDGEEIKGATKQFYCDENGLVGSYSVKVTTTDGKTIYSCAKEFNTPTKKSIVITPNPVKVSQDCTVRILGFDDQILAKSELSIFNVDGIMVYHSDNVDQSNKMKLPDTPGIYIGHVTTENETNYVFKIVVTK